MKLKMKLHRRSCFGVMRVYIGSDVFNLLTNAAGTLYIAKISSIYGYYVSKT